jgi:hypothetical protein
MLEFLHERNDFHDLIVSVANQNAIDPVLVEKDYWIMHCLWGLQNLGFNYELKGGTSLSKGYGVIHRFSEDIDIRIDPPFGMEVKIGRNQDKFAHIESRRTFYNWLCENIKIPGIVNVERDTAFDDEKLRSAGIRLQYSSKLTALAGVKEGVLLELGFDDTAPNQPVTVSSWAFDLANQFNVQVRDNRAVDVRCYAPTHTFVEKLQTISTKYRRLSDSPVFPSNFLRHYYDVYCLLDVPNVQSFLGTSDYEARKKQRFRTDDEIVIANNPAFTLTDSMQRNKFKVEYQKTAALYYNGQPSFDVILQRIAMYIDRM